MLACSTDLELQAIVALCLLVGAVAVFAWLVVIDRKVARSIRNRKARYSNLLDGKALKR